MGLLFAPFPFFLIPLAEVLSGILQVLVALLLELAVFQPGLDLRECFESGNLVHRQLEASP